MKKFLALMLCLVLALSFVACANTGNGENSDTESESVTDNSNNSSFDASVKSEGVMTYAEYMAAEKDAEVVIEAFVQAHQSWWDNKITVYAQDPDGAYFLYEMACSEDDAAKLTAGTKIKVTGYKGEWAGEIEIMDATFEFVESEKWIAPVTDVTSLLSNETELVKHQNKFVSFKDLTVVSVNYKNGEPGDDIYVTVAQGDVEYSFCVEVYLTGPDTEVYKKVGTLVPGAKIDVEGFLYWYEGVNTHITDVTVSFDPTEKSEGVMTYADYMAAEKNDEVVIEAFVQAHQAWWDNKITVYAQDPDGAYFLYEMACSEEDAAKLTAGTKIKVTGYKGEWAGEIEIMDATFEFVESEKWVAEAFDATELLANEAELVKHQNELVSFKDLEIVKIEYKNGEPGDDIYVTVKQGEATYSFCVEIYLTGENTDVYKTVGTLNAGDKVDIEGFLYWYEGVNTHITAVTKK